MGILFPRKRLALWDFEKLDFNIFVFRARKRVEATVYSSSRLPFLFSEIIYKPVPDHAVENDPKEKG